jgi:hypothetical protein
MQTRTQSLVETFANYTIAFAIAWVSNRYVLHYFGYPVKASETTYITLIFTTISIARSYVCRRIFNRLHK